MQHRVRDELHFVLSFIALIWSVQFVNVLTGSSLNQWGLSPRTVSGLIGIVTMPFLHANWTHLLNNTIPLLVLMCLLAGSAANSFRVVTLLVVTGGTLLWLCGRGGVLHIGASGLVYGLAAFHIVAGFTERRISAILIAVVVTVLYGVTLFSGMLPFVTSNEVSWDGHFTGAVAGAIVAWWQSGANTRQG